MTAISMAVVPFFSVYICDRCARRHEGDMPPGWCEIHVLEAYREDDNAEPPPDMVMGDFVLCDECAPVALRQMRSWVGSASRSN